MAQDSVRVTYKPMDEERLPDQVTPGALLLMELSRSGVVQQVGERLHIRRQGGYCGLDIWLFLQLFFSAGPRGSLKDFREALRPHLVQVAALAQRRTLPGTAAVSRALDAVETELVRPVASFLLSTLSGIEPLLQNPSVLTRDTAGRGWHVFDVDPTVTTLRQRALPLDETLPEPRRRAGATGAPGHTGRKRGELQFRRITVQHAGSGAWLHAHLSKGNGEGIADLESALDTIVATCTRIGAPLTRVLVRLDGEYGNVPSFTACRERGLPFITRLNRPKLYEDPEILATMRAATWYDVPDSLCGPNRSATELGMMTIAAGEQTRRSDKSRYEPVKVRVVACRFPKTGQAKRGVVLDGYQVELFAVDLPADAWPAPEAIAEYFGRAAEENRFAQEDRELGLDRIISYHLPGQELALLCGLSLWNLRLARGFASEGVPDKENVARLRQVRVDDRAPEHWPRDPVLISTLEELPWPTILEKHPGWQWEKDTHALHCPEGRLLSLTTVRPTEHTRGRTNLILRRPSGGCEDCTHRPECLLTSRTDTVKHIELSVSTPVAVRLRARLELVRKRKNHKRMCEPVVIAAGPLSVEDALFRPATARQIFCEVFQRATVHIQVRLPADEPPRPRLVYKDVADRQRRRKTWAENLERNALPKGADVKVDIAGSEALRRMLGDIPPSMSSARTEAI